jgi:hypothetical protein
LLHRRACRAELRTATDHLGVAEQKLADANQHAEPTNRARNSAKQDLSHARHTLSSNDILDRWNYHPERLRDAETRVDALDTWRQWAQGHPVDRNLLADTVETLTNSPDTAIDLLPLANVVRHWAGQKNIDLQPHRAHAIKRPELGIEIDF